MNYTPSMDPVPKSAAIPADKQTRRPNHRQIPAQLTAGVGAARNLGGRPGYAALRMSMEGGGEGLQQLDSPKDSTRGFDEDVGDLCCSLSS